MKQFKICVALLLSIVSVGTARGQVISADRPGAGSDAEVVPLYTLQAEVGTDTKELRFGIAKNVEISKDTTSFGIKYGIRNTDKFKLSAKISYDRNSGIVFEVPMQYIVSKYFYLGTDVILSNSQKTFLTEYSITPTSRLTITDAIYYDSKLRNGIFIAWIPPKHDNVQFDIGYDQKKVIVGVSIAANLHKK